MIIDSLEPQGYKNMLVMMAILNGVELFTLTNRIFKKFDLKEWIVLFLIKVEVAISQYFCNN